MALTAQWIWLCYAFIAGIAAGHRWPEASWPGAVLCAIGFGALIAGTLGHRPQRSGLAQVLRLAALLGIGFGCGQIRHRIEVRRPDTLVATVLRTPHGTAIHSARPLQEAGLWRVVVEGPVREPLRFRLVGEVDARVSPTPQQDPQADPGGRWKFETVPLVVTTDVVHVEPEDPASWTQLLSTPLSRLVEVVWERAPEHVRLRIQRPCHRIGLFAAVSSGRSPLRILGHVSGDPVVYDHRTVLPVTPHFVQYPVGGPWLRVEGGLLHVGIRASAPEHPEWSGSRAYGRLVEIQGRLELPQSELNPGGFDQRRHLAYGGVEASVWLRRDAATPVPIREVRMNGAVPSPYRNRFVAFSLALRDQLTRVIKQTVPYPQSAFVGAVTLGLRYGLQNVLCLRHRPDPFGGPGSSCLEFVTEEMRAAGVNHVLAVSGLHVTILTILLVGMFSLVRFPRAFYTPMVLVALVVFAIITGSRPSTVRAVIMNGLTLLAWAYFGRSLRSSVLLGAPVAATLILAHNPRVLTDPSFVLSFGAILSLGLLTEPIWVVLHRLRGWRLLGVVLGVAALLAISAVHWPWVTTPAFWLLAAAAVAVAELGIRALERAGYSAPAWLTLERLPVAVSGFLAAQIGIQIGMMMPLSAYFFCRWPLAGAWANLVAIPLIGVIVQLGVLGGALGLIPGIGLPLALWLGGVNWLASSAFLLLGHFASHWSAYPFVRRPNEMFLLAWYTGLALWLWRAPLAEWIRRRTGRPNAARAAALFATAVLIVTGIGNLRYHPPAAARITFLSVGYGGATLIESPGGRRILLDGGRSDPDRPSRNQAVRTVLPFLSSMNIRSLDALVITSPRPERVGSTATLLRHLWVRTLVWPPAIAALATNSSRDVVAAQFGISLDSPLAAQIYSALVGTPDAPGAHRMMTQRGPTWWNRLAGWAVAPRMGAAGDVILREAGPAGEFRVEVLWPPKEDSVRSVDRSAMILSVVYGTARVILSGDAPPEVLRHIVAEVATTGRVDILTAPHHGAPAELPADLASAEVHWSPVWTEILKRSGARAVVAEYGYPGGIPGAPIRQRETAYALTRATATRVLGNDGWWSTAEGAVVVECFDGQTWTGPRRAARAFREASLD